MVVTMLLNITWVCSAHGCDGGIKGSELPQFLAFKTGMSLTNQRTFTISLGHVAKRHAALPLHQTHRFSTYVLISACRKNARSTATLVTDGTSVRPSEPIMAM